MFMNSSSMAAHHHHFNSVTAAPTSYTLASQKSAKGTSAGGLNLFNNTSYISGGDSRASTQNRGLGSLNQTSSSKLHQLQMVQ